MSPLSGVRYGAAIESAALSHGLDPVLLAAVAAQETGGPDVSSGNNVVGDGGHGHGLFQIDDRYHDFASSAAAMDPAQNANFAASMIQTNLKATGGDLHAALSMYNSGSATASGTATTWADGRTLGYADSVMRHARQIAGSPLAAQLTAGLSDDAASVNGLSAYASATAAGASAATGSTSSSSAPQLQIPTPDSSDNFTFHSYQSEMQAASGPSNDADKKLSGFVDVDSDVFGAAPESDEPPT